MALEYVLYASADVATEEILAFMANAVGGEIVGTFVRRDALEVTAYRDDPGDEAPIGGMLGFTHRVTATYRLSSRATDEARDEATRAMIRSVLSFFTRYPSDGVLLHDDSRIILQPLNGPVVIDSDWEDWTEVPGMSHVVAGLDRRSLPQPLR
ncbi:SitI3 family protein [Micromonospora sp. HM5-17]|uniref:SitI3 family protein n=1 Tax=Micromonospora sp. HM5-17 TaxID=2487710 RepID=UPI0011CE8A12|nr:SitI3 family protein [Micromonospora sp. HM5-17]